MRHGLCLRQAAARFALSATETSLRQTASLVPHAILQRPNKACPHDAVVDDASPSDTSTRTQLSQPRKRASDYLATFRALLKDPHTTSVPTSALPEPDELPADIEQQDIWPKTAVLAALGEHSDQAFLIRFIPIALRFVDNAKTGAGIKVTRRLLLRIRIARLLPAVPFVMDAVFLRLRQAVENGEADKGSLMEMVDALLSALLSFRKSSNLRDPEQKAPPKTLPPTVIAEVLRLTSFAFEMARSFPSSSTSPSTIRHELRHRLFSHVAWIPGLRQVLLSHIQRKKLSPAEWRACAYSFLSEGGPHAASRARVFTEAAQKAEHDLRKREDGQEREGAVKAGVEKSRVSADLLEVADRITLARCGATAQSVIQSLQPFLEVQPANGNAHVSTVRPYAWSILINRLSHSPHITNHDLIDISNEIGEDLTIPHIMTPIITGLAARGDLEQAWSIFLDLSDKQRHRYVAPGRYVDRQLLAAVTPVCAELLGLPVAVQLIDDWARRASLPPTSDWLHSIPIDPINLNVLLTLYIRAGRPSVPLRLLAAALPRWGVWPDEVSLKLVLDCCRFAVKTETDEPDTIRSRLRDLVGDIHLFSSTNSTQPPNLPVTFDIPSLAEQETEILLDPKGSSWRQMMGSMRPWQYGRQLFRDVIFGNWPHLVNIHSPLEFGTFASLEDILMPYDPPIPGELRLPSPSARYTHLIPTAQTFQSYITLLGFYNFTEEIPTALSWARELGLEPTFNSMCSALAFIGEVEGPRRRVRRWHADGGSGFVRDEEIMRRWLEEWVRGDVPTEGDVAQFVRTIRDRGGRMSLESRWGKDS